MQILPKNGPTILSPPTAHTQSNSAQEARARAIAVLEGKNQPAKDQPIDPNKVSVEDLSALRQPSNDQKVGQSDKIEASQEVSTEATNPPAEVKDATAPSPLSSQYAQLARKEKALRAQAKQIEAEKARIAAQDAEIKAKEQRYNELSLQERIKKDPMSVLNEFGVTYDQLTNAALNAPKPEDPTISELKAEIKRLSDAQSKTDKNFEDQQTQSYKQAVNQIKLETKQLVNTDESFEMIKATNSHDDVVQLIEETYKQDGVLLTVEEAAKAVEDYLVEEAIKVARLKKIQNRLTPQQSKEAVASEAKEQTKQTQTKTLTNGIASTRQLTAKERAILAFKGELQKK